MPELPHHYQQTPVTCGPTVARMVLEHLRGERRSEEALAHVLGTDADGTRPRHMIDGLRQLGLAVEVHDGTVLGEVREALGDGCDVIVCYQLPEQGIDHYAVLRGTDGRTVLLCDPIYGPERELPAEIFLQRWAETPTTPAAMGGWWLAVS